MARVRALGSPSGLAIGTKYTVVADDLWAAQSHKCAYCEGQEQRKRNDVEHFRPKGRIDEGSGTYITPGYWWLAWSWRNLLFSCRNCNQSPAKLDKFPLMPGSPRLAAEDEPPGSEEPLLIDPYLDEPMDHIVFQVASFAGRNRWGPIARNGSERGRRTIEILLLDRDDLLVLYSDHVQAHIEPDATELADELKQGNLQSASRLWTRLLRLVDQKRPFAALSYDAIDHYVPDALRQKLNLILPRP